MRDIIYWIKFSFTYRFYTIAGLIAMMMVSGYFYAPLLSIAITLLLLLILFSVAELFLLFRLKHPLLAKRICGARFSNGDENSIVIEVTSRYAYLVHVRIADELPAQLVAYITQEHLTLRPKEVVEVVKMVRPVERGEYGFGRINVTIVGLLGLVNRYYITGSEETVAVYPSFLQARKYQLKAIANQLQETGQRPIRKMGNSLEFEQIKEYIAGDDYRTINWKATARRGALMVNNFMDERSQQIICIIDKGRTMKMAFNEMTILDHAINASLVLSNVALIKQDKAGLITFGKKIDHVLQPERRKTQFSLILETLYKQQTHFLNADFEAMYTGVRQYVKQRSLLVLFTNFESIYALERQLPYLIKLATYHALLVVFFENTELRIVQEKKITSIQDIYVKITADQFFVEKKLMVKALHNHGILTLLTSPDKLTASVVNKYLEIKARQVI